MKFKNSVIKIISVVLVLCSLISVFLIPVSAATKDGDSRSFFTYHTVPKYSLLNPDNILSVYNVPDNLRAFQTDNVLTKFIISTKTGQQPIKLFSIQSTCNESYLKGDKLSINISLLSKFSEAVALFIYFDDGSREMFTLDRSSVYWSSDSWVVAFSNEPTSFGGNQVYCHKYTTFFEYEFTENKTVIAYQFQQQFPSSGFPSFNWFYFEHFFWEVNRANSNSNKGFTFTLSSILSSITNFFSTMKDFILKFTNKLSDVFSPLVNSIGTWISNSTTTVWNNFKTVLSNIKDGITSIPQKLSELGNVIISPFKSIPETISNWFQNTFLGKVLRITNKSKVFISQAGNDVQYAALDDEVGESTEEISPDDWDMIHRPSFEIDVDYYNNLYPNVFDTGG